MFMNANEPNTDSPFINEAIEGWINQANISNIILIMMLAVLTLQK